MAKTQDIFSFNPNLEKHILWQYDNAKVLKSLIEAKAQWQKGNVGDFWVYVRDKFLNIQTADDWGLNLWGEILKVKRILNVNGVSVSLSTELFRKLVLGKLQLCFSNGTIPEILKYMNFIFADHSIGGMAAVSVFDNHDMTIRYLFNFVPSDEELALIYDRSFLPTPAGVDAVINLLPANNIFGFYGSEFQPFNQAPFWGGNFN